MIQYGAEIDASRRSPRTVSNVRNASRRPSRLDADDQRIYLFIYRIRHRARQAGSDDARFCAVLVLGRSRSAAERIAINCVHQHGWHILKTDTATALERAELCGDDGAIYRADLEAFGAAFRLLGHA